MRITVRGGDSPDIVLAAARAQAASRQADMLLALLLGPDDWVQNFALTLADAKKSPSDQSEPSGAEKDEVEGTIARRGQHADPPRGGDDEVVTVAEAMGAEKDEVEGLPLSRDPQARELVAKKVGTFEKDAGDGPCPRTVPWFPLTPQNYEIHKSKEKDE
jgi:hypothetical protein